MLQFYSCLFFFSSRRRHTRFDCDWSSDVCSSDLETDTEVLAHLIEEHVAKGSPLVEAVAGALHQVDGTYGIAVLSTREPDRSGERRVGEECRSRWSPYH